MNKITQFNGGSHIQTCNDGGVSEAKPESTSEFTKRYKKRFGITDKDVIKKIPPTHGTCCTCQDCGFSYDDCVCELNYRLEACNIIDWLEAELSLYRRNFCEAHQPLDNDSFTGCYACEMVKMADRIKDEHIKLENDNGRLRQALIRLASSRAMYLGGAISREEKARMEYANRVANSDEQMPLWYIEDSVSNEIEQALKEK